MHPDHEGENALPGLCARGDETAWRDLVSGFHSLVAGIFRRILQRRGLPHGDRELEEAAADFFGDLCRRRERTLGRFRGGSLRAFLAVSAANYARTRATRALQWRERNAAYREAAVQESSPDGPRGPQDAGDRIRSVLGRCSDQERLLFRILYVEGASTDAACAFLGVSPQVLYLRKHRFHQRVRSLLQERSPSGAESPRGATP